MKSRTEALCFTIKLLLFAHIFTLFISFRVVFYRSHIKMRPFGERGVAAVIGGRGAAAALSPRQAPQERGSE